MEDLSPSDDEQCGYSNILNIHRVAPEVEGAITS